MFRILFFLAVVFALGLGFAWLADRPGHIVLTFAGYQYQATLMVAAVVVTSIVAAAMISWWLVKSIWNSPYAISRYFRVRRRDRGYQALSTGMIAAGAGDAVLARRKKKEALKLISADQEPLIHLLDAQASLLEGDHAAARGKFEAMLDDPETRLLGLRGLYLEAQRLGDREAARHYAARAVEEAPQLGWASNATLEVRTAAGDWDEALRLVEAQKSTHQVEREVAQRRRAVLLTAKSMEMLDGDPAGAKAAALEANRLAPDFVPAAIAAAKALFRLDDLRKGARILEAVWKNEPHPEVAEIYVHARHGDSTHDRLTRAKKLRSLRTNNVESELAVARAALDAGELALAREAAEAALRISPREGGYLLMADIEEADTGEQGKVREWLARALRAPREPAWVADGHVSRRWAPFSPVTGRFDAFEWRPPVERLGEVIEPFRPQEDEPRQIAVGVAEADVVSEAPRTPVTEPNAKPAEPLPVHADAAGKEQAAPDEARMQPSTQAAAAPHAPSAPEPAPVAAVVKPTPRASAPQAANDASKPGEARPSTVSAGASATVAGAAAASVAPAAAAGAEPVPAGPIPDAAPVRSKAGAVDEMDDDADVPLRSRMPDDPGVDPKDEDEPAEAGRFRLF